MHGPGTSGLRQGTCPLVSCSRACRTSWPGSASDEARCAGLDGPPGRAHPGVRASRGSGGRDAAVLRQPAPGSLRPLGCRDRHRQRRWHHGIRQHAARRSQDAAAGLPGCHPRRAGARTQLLFSLAAAGGGRGFTLALRPDRWSLAESFPQLANPALEGLTLSNVMLVVTDQDISRDASELSEDEAGFYQDIFGRPDFKLVLKPGLNLLAGIPTEGLAPNHPLKAITGALGIETGTIFLRGTLGKSFALLTSPGAGGAAATKDLHLLAGLPPMRPPGSPDWFRHGQLALEITGDPAVRLVGEMTVRIQQDELLFALAAALARRGVSLRRRVRSEPARGG